MHGMFCMYVCHLDMWQKDKAAAAPRQYPNDSRIDETSEMRGIRGT